MTEKPNLDLMRALAVSMVVAEHVLLALGVLKVGPWDTVQLGLVAVYIFFIHTCLVLMWSLERKPHTLNFYIRRAFRIFPLAMVVILIAVISRSPVGWTVTDFFIKTPLTLPNLFLNLALLQNISAHGSNIVAVMWSLPLEVQMYIFLPVIFAFAAREMKIWPLLVLWTCAALLIHSMYPGRPGNNFAVVIPDFIPGVVAYVGFKTRKERLPSWILLVLVIGACLLNASISKYRADWLACLVIGLVLPSLRQISNAALKKASHTIATYSYGIYLTHPFGIVFGFYFLSGHSIWLQMSVLLVTTAFMSYAGYHLIEHPMIKAGGRFARYVEDRFGADSLDASLKI